MWRPSRETSDRLVMVALPWNSSSHPLVHVLSRSGLVLCYFFLFVSKPRQLVDNKCTFRVYYAMIRAFYELSWVKQLRHGWSVGGGVYSCEYWNHSNIFKWKHLLFDQVTSFCKGFFKCQKKKQFHFSE